MSKIANQELFETMPVARAVGKMAIPTVIGQLIVLAYNLADTFFLGRTNDPYMVAAAALILPVFNISLSVASVAGVGGSALLSALLGQSRHEEARRVYSFSVLLSLLLGLLFSLAALCFMQPLLKLLGADRNTFDFARSYATCVVVLGGIPTIMVNVLSNFVRSVGESGKAGFGVMLGGILNILLDPLFMFVLLPQGSEIFGAGIATFLSNCISCLYFVIVLLRLRKSTPLRLTSPKKLPEKSSIRKIFAAGVPNAFGTLLFDVDYIILDKLMSGYGGIALAAVGITLKAERLPLNVGIGICQGMLPIVAYNYSSKNYTRMKQVSHFCLRLGILCSVVSIALYEIFAGNIMRVFINEPQTVALGTDFLRIRCLATVFMFMSFYHVFLFNAYVRGKEATLLNIFRWGLFNIPMLFLFNRLFGMYGLVLSQVVSDVLTATVSFLVHKKFLRSRKI